MKGVGEQVFAVEYRVVKRKIWGANVVLDSTVEWGSGMFGDEEGKSQGEEKAVVVGLEYQLADDPLEELPPQYELISGD